MGTERDIDPIVDYQRQLKEQLQVVARSAQAVMKGHPHEALRIATAIRIAAHQTRSNPSLLTRLGAPNPEMLSTAQPLRPNVSFGESGLTLRKYDGKQMWLEPVLGRAATKEHVRLAEWWKETVYVRNRLSLTRRQLVLLAANRDGGAQCDVTLPPNYEALKSSLWIEPPTSGSGQSIEHLEYEAMLTLVQVGFEFNYSPGVLRLVGLEQHAL